MAVLAITNTFLYNVETQADLEVLGSNDGITADTIAWVEGMKTWCWPDTITATTSTWNCGDLSGTVTWGFQTNLAVGYAGGFYDLAALPNTFSPSVNFGTANVARAAHAFIVVGAVPAAAVNILVGATASGSGIDDNGVRTAGASETIVIPGGTAVGTYFETGTKFNGQVNFSVSSGTPISCNYGWAKYHDIGNQDFIVLGLEALWESDSTDSTSNISLQYHSATGWTYNASGPVTIPAALVDRSTDFGADNTHQVGAGAWKRTNLSQTVIGSGSEGVLLLINSGSTGGGSLSFRDLNLQLSIRMS